VNDPNELAHFAIQPGMAVDSCERNKTCNVSIK